MQVKVTKITDNKLLNLCLEYSLPSDKRKELNVSLKDIYVSEHSPIYSQIFVIELIGIPNFVHVHFRTHKKEFIFECARTFRTDKTNVKQDRNTPTDMIIICNAKKIIDIGLKRLCKKSSPETIEVMQMIKEEFLLIDSDLHSFIVPKCVYRNGICNEPKCCGYIHTDNFQTELSNYLFNFKHALKFVKV